MIKELSEIMDEWIGNDKVILIVGDFNARIGKWQIDGEGETVEIREMENSTVNNEGIKLINFCEEVGGVIRNGSTKGDWEGKVTYVRGGLGIGASVLYLIIEIGNDKGSIVNELVMSERLKSDHLSVEIYIGSVKGLGRNVGIKEKMKKEYRLRWRKDKRKEYEKKMEERGVEAKIEGRRLQKR